VEYTIWCRCIGFCCAQGGIHHLVPLYRFLADKGRRNHDGLEMHVIFAGHHRMAAAQSRLDDFRYLLWTHALSLKLPKLTSARISIRCIIPG